MGFIQIKHDGQKLCLDGHMYTVKNSKHGVVTTCYVALCEASSSCSMSGDIKSFSNATCTPASIS